MSWEDAYGRSHDAEYVGAHLSDLCEEVKRLRLAVEDGLELMDKVLTRSTGGTSPQP